MRAVALAIFLSLTVIGTASAQVTGRATVLGSDTISVRGQVFSLYGIDVVEFHQFCFVDGDPWACGASATRALQILLDPFAVTCEQRGDPVNGVAPGLCTTDEGDVADLMMQQGWGFADRAQTEDYVAVEEAARAAGEGIWRGVATEPWIFREEIAAIEARYVEGVAVSLTAEADELLGAAELDVPVFEGIGTTPSAAATALDQAIVVGWLGEGFIFGAIEERGVFNWRLPAAALGEWYSGIVNRIRDSAFETMWLALATRPRTVVEVADAEAYYAALRERAAGWLAEGRQPTLMVAAIGVPEWVTLWFSGEPPEGAEIVQKEGMDARYLGTIDGIDVFYGDAPDAESLLFPSDLLLALGYETNAGGGIIDLAVRADAAEATISYRQLTEWRNDTIVGLAYPYEPPPDGPYGS